MCLQDPPVYSRSCLCISCGEKPCHHNGPVSPCTCTTREPRIYQGKRTKQNRTELNRWRPYCQITNNTLRKPLHVTTRLPIGLLHLPLPVLYQGAGKARRNKVKNNNKKKKQRSMYTKLKSQRKITTKHTSLPFAKDDIFAL